MNKKKYCSTSGYTRGDLFNLIFILTSILIYMYKAYLQIPLHKVNLYKHFSFKMRYNCRVTVTNNLT